MLCLHKYRALGKLYGFLPREGHGLALSLLLKVTEEKMSQILDNSADAILFPLLYYLLYVGPMMQKGDIFLGSVQIRLGKSKPDFCASGSTKMHAEQINR